MSYHVIRRGLILMAIVTTCCSSTHAQIYFDDFDGDAAADLNGTVPDIGLGDATWMAGSGSPSWTAAGTKPEDGVTSAWLPFSPSTGETYRLSLDVDPDISESNDWFSIGFSETNSTGAWHTTNTVAAWMLSRENDASDSTVQTFVGLGTAEGASHDFDPDKVGKVNLSVVLSTTSAPWSIEWFVDDESIRSATFQSNPTINYVGMGAWNTATGRVDNFSLTLVPEPTSLCLVAIGAAILAARSRRP